MRLHQILICLCLVTLFALSKANHSDRLLGILSFAGGVYVLYLACGCLRTGPVSLEEARDRPRSLRKGALINALNPHPYLF